MSGYIKNVRFAQTMKVEEKSEKSRSSDQKSSKKGAAEYDSGDDGFNSENPQDSLDEEGEGEYKPTIRVSDGIKRFQEEIKKREQENKKWNKWKKEKTKPTVYRSGSIDSMLDCDLEPLEDIKLPQRNIHLSQDDLLPVRPNNKKSSQKRVSYAVNEVTILGPRGYPGPYDEEEEKLIIKKNMTLYNSKSETKSRQITPSTHLPPQEPPSNGDIVIRSSADHPPLIPQEDYQDENEEDENQAPIPMLPSVKDLTSKFQARKSASPEIKKIKPQPEKIPEMLKISKSQASKYNQVHSLTARSVSREFREGLKAGKSKMTDTIVKLPENHVSRHTTVNNNVLPGHKHRNVVPSFEPRSPPEARHGSKYTKSENYSRNLSPEHSGIPARPLVIPSRRSDHDAGNTSDDSLNYAVPDHRRSPARGRRSPSKSKGRHSPGGTIRSPSMGRTPSSGRHSSAGKHSSGSGSSKKEWTVWT